MTKNDLIGIKEVQALLKTVDKVASKVITKAAKAGAKIALNYAKTHCPKSADGQPYGKYPHPPGTLRRSLKLKSEKRKKGKRVYQVGPNKDGWYAHFIDYGFTDKKGVYHAGNRFLRNAVDLNRGTINQTILSELADGLKEVR